MVEDDRETPDFIVIAPERTVGIELKRLFRPDHPERGSLCAQERLMDMIANKARAIYETRDLPLVDVHILFHRPRLRKSDIVRYAEEIASLVEYRIMTIEGTESIQTDEVDVVLNALPGVARIHIIRRPTLKENFFAPSMAARRPRVGVQYVQAAIDSKNVKLPQYDRRCTENWLLLAYGREGLPASMSFADEVFGHTYKTDFQRVFLFGWREELNELSLERATTP